MEEINIIECTNIGAEDFRVMLQEVKEAEEKVDKRLEEIKRRERRCELLKTAALFYAVTGTLFALGLAAYLVGRVAYITQVWG